MKRNHKIALIITGSVLIVTGLGIAIYHLTKSDDSESEENSDVNPYVGSQNVGATQSQSSGSGSDESTINTDSSWSNDLIEPTFNIEGELSNSPHQLKDRYLYPKRTSSGGWGYSNVRSSAEVNNDQGWWDGSDNLITTINSGTPIGRVISETTGVYNGYSYRWFKVKLARPTGGWFTPYTEGYVRADTVTIKAYQR